MTLKKLGFIVATLFVCVGLFFGIAIFVGNSDDTQNTEIVEEQNMYAPPVVPYQSDTVDDKNEKDAMRSLDLN